MKYAKCLCMYSPDLDGGQVVNKKNHPQKQVLVAIHNRELKTAVFLTLASEKRCKIVGTAVNTAELLTLTRALQPDAILLEWSLPGSSLIENLPALLQASNKTQIFLIGTPSTQQQCREAAQTHDQVFVEESPETLITALITNGA